MRFRITFYMLLFIAAGICLVNSCQPSDKQNQLAGIKKEPDNLGSIAALPDTARYPANNPASGEKTELGRLLFYDPILSGDKTVACATCHHPEFMYAESLETSIGVNGTGLGMHRTFNTPNDIPFTKRNAQSLLNIAFNGIDVNGNYLPEKAPMFWDLRANGLEAQALLPIQTFEEMRGHQFEEEQIADVVVKRLSAIADYRNLFRKAFPGSNAISMDLVTKALANFQRSLIANNSRFDQYMRGNNSALSNSEIEGMSLFISSGCARCHSGPMLSDYKTHVMGIADNENLASSDSGFRKSYAFRTPSLRNLRFTSPYMHSGKIKTLENVLTFYEDLHGKELPNKNVKRENLDPLALKLKLEFKNINAILEFLNTLNDVDFDKKIPKAVPSGLQVGGKI